MCVAPWFETLDDWLVRFFSAFAAALIIVSCYFTAPAARTVVAWVVFAAGVWIAVVSWAWGEFMAAGVGGVAAVLLLTRGQDILRRTNRVARKRLAKADETNPATCDEPIMRETTKRSIVRWVHLIFAIPIIGYVYSPFKELPNYAPVVRYVAVPVIALTGLWMWEGHLLRRLVSRKSI